MTSIAVQMYTVRRQAQESLPESLPATLAKLKEIGYDAVETAGTYGLSTQQMRRHLDEAGLALCSAHVPLPESAGAEAEATFAGAAELGATSVFPSLRAEHFADETAIGRAADRFNRALPFAQAAGIELGYHNHWWELARLPDGRTGYDHFRERLDPAVIFEVDTYWAQVGGVDAGDLVASLGDRVRHLHIKDGPIRREPPQSAVGAGKMDVPRLLAANPAVEWAIVELDEHEGDIFAVLAESLAYLTRLVA